ncbi:MAG: hypothetical protein WA709_30965 [Stellaceae bacterium]
MIVDLETKSLIEEYKSLRHEIGQRVYYQYLIIGGELALVSAALGFLSQVFVVEKLNIFLLSPPIFIAISWLYIEQDVFITHAASYLHQTLRPLIISRIAEETQRPQDRISIMDWERFRNTVLFRTHANRFFFRVMLTFRLLATTMPVIGLLIGALYLILTKPDSYKNLNIFQYGLFGLDLLGFGFLVYQYQSVKRLFVKIAA